MGAGPHSSTRANSSVMSGEYYDVNDFLAREHAVTVEFVDGASSLGPEVVGKRTTHISNKPTTPNGDADGDDVPREHVARVPVWWLDGELCRDLLIQETCTREVFSDDVFNKLEAENGAKILDLRSVNESYFGFAACVLSALAYFDSIAVAYRDLKPENLLIDEQGHIRLIDMGLAARVTKKSPKRRSASLANAMHSCTSP